VLTIAETGIGIAPQDQERIFKEYVQLQGPDGARDHGVGLGLAIVRHIRCCSIIASRWNRAARGC
jgi:two-component system, sensor histidine kinase